MRKELLLFAISLNLILGILSLAFRNQVARASGPIYIRADGSVEPLTANITSVDNVTYTFTDKINAEIIVERDDIVVDGAGYTLQGDGSGIGIYLLLRSNVTIKNTEITNFWAGIQLSLAWNNTISGNNITAWDYCGIYITYASHNTISGNTITDPIDPGYIHGIYLDENSGNNIISGNYIDGFWWNGIYSKGSSNNIISGNNMKNNMNGIYLDGGSNNIIYHNNFIGCPNPCFFGKYASMHTFDAGYPLGGNYWCDYYGGGYTGVDLFSGLFQNETGSDGIGDTPHIMDYDNKDNYPLMGMFSDFKATSEYDVQTICNSSISDFHYNSTALCFNAAGEDDTTGFCRICIPRALMNETYQVFVNGTEVPHNLLPCSNTIHSYLYFTYSHSTQEVIVIPEFSEWASMLLLLIGLAAAITVHKRKLLKPPVS